MGKLLAVDGNSLTHRAFHAYMARDGSTGRRNNQNEPVWAIEGLIGFLAILTQKVQATHLLIGFDDVKSSKRKEMLPDYKGTRSVKHDDLVTQLKMMPEILKEYGISVITPDALEADDVMASASEWAKENNHHCFIATSDRDSFALINENTTVLRLVNGGADQAELYTPDKLYSKYGVKPEAYLMYAALRGDSSDNLPGVSGIGEKTAAKIVAITPTFKDLTADLNTDLALSNVLSKSILSKLQNEESTQKLTLNVKMMSFHPVEITEVTKLPLNATSIRNINERKDLRVGPKLFNFMALPIANHLTSENSTLDIFTNENDIKTQNFAHEKIEVKNTISANENFTHSIHTTKKEYTEKIVKILQTMYPPTKNEGVKITENKPKSENVKVVKPTLKVYHLENERKVKSLLTASQY